MCFAHGERIGVGGTHRVQGDHIFHWLCSKCLRSMLNLFYDLIWFGFMFISLSLCLLNICHGQWSINYNSFGWLQPSNLLSCFLVNTICDCTIQNSTREWNTVLWVWWFVWVFGLHICTCMFSILSMVQFLLREIKHWKLT